jgi:eukaryotic-like serine/threonine-protein kinase
LCSLCHSWLALFVCFVIRRGFVIRKSVNHDRRSSKSNNWFSEPVNSQDPITKIQGHTRARGLPARNATMKNCATALALIAVVCAAPIAGPRAAEGPTFRGDLRHTGAYEGAGVPELHGVKWKFRTKGQVYSSPAIAGGLAFVGSTDGSLYAIDVATGSARWMFATKARVTSSPAVSAGVVYFGSYDSNIYAVDVATGALKWKFTTKGEKRYIAPHIHGMLPAAEPVPDPFDFYLSSPAISNGVVYVGSGDGNVYALDASTGALKWAFPTGDVVHASPAVSDGLVFIGSWDTYFYALDAATGSEKWKFKTGEDLVIHNQTGIQASAAVADGVVYFGCRDAKLYALDARTGIKKWSFDNKGSWVIGSPAVKDGKVFFTTSDSGLFHVVDAWTGEEDFSMSFKWPMFSSPAVAGNLVYIGSHQGKLLAIDYTTHKTAWTFETDASRENGPALTSADGQPNYAAAMSSMFFDEVVSGVQKMLSVGAILSSPVVVDDTIYVGSADGYLYAIR